jgi:DNA polymerase III subunit delta
MLIFLYGPDTWRSQQKLSEFKQEFTKKKDPQGLSIVIFDNQNLNLNNLRNAFLSSGLFTEKRLIIIKNFFSPLTLKISTKTKNFFEEILNILKKTKQQKDNILIFWDEEINEKKLNPEQKKIYQLLKKEPYQEEFKALKKPELKTWIKNQAINKNITIDQLAQEALIEICGANLWSLKNELEKLIALKSGTLEKTINLKDVQKNLLPALEENIWALTDALGQRKKALALKIFSDLSAQNIEIEKILLLLAHQYRTILRIKSYLKNNPNENYNQVSVALSLHPYVCKKGMDQEKKYTLSELKKIYQQLLKIDFLKKTKKINSQILLDLLIIKS